MEHPGIDYLLLHDSEVPDDDGWLGPAERRVLAGLRIPKRRHDWRLGRWTIKRALRLRGEPEPERTLEICAAADGAPELVRDGRTLPLPISISHRGPWGLGAIGTTGMRLGCDLEAVEPKTDSFLRDYFTAAELDRVTAAGPQRDRIAMVIWASKEATLKAVRTGLRRDTRSVEVHIGAALDTSWTALRVQDHASGRPFEGAWRSHGNYVLAIVSEPAVRSWRDLSATV